MISMLAIVLATSTPTADMAQLAKPGSIRLRVRARANGFRLSCRGILLIPRSALADAQIRDYFGALDRGVRTVGYDDLRRRTSDANKPAEGAREVKCAGGSRITDVRPGSYYVVATMVSNTASGQGVAERRTGGVDLMRQVEVRPDETVTVELKKF